MQTKLCSKCKFEKLTHNFCNEKSVSDGFSRWCRACKKIAKTGWDATNVEVVRDYQIKYLHLHVERTRKTQSIYRDANRNKRRANSNAWNRANPEKMTAACMRRVAAKLNAMI